MEDLNQKKSVTEKEKVKTLKLLSKTNHLMIRWKLNDLKKLIPFETTLEKKIQIVPLTPQNIDKMDCLIKEIKDLKIEADKAETLINKLIPTGE